MKDCDYPGCRYQAISGYRFCAPHLDLVRREMESTGYLTPTGPGASEESDLEEVHFTGSGGNLRKGWYHITQGLRTQDRLS